MTIVLMQAWCSGLMFALGVLALLLDGPGVVVLMGVVLSPLMGALAVQGASTAQQRARLDMLEAATKVAAGERMKERG